MGPDMGMSELGYSTVRVNDREAVFVKSDVEKGGYINRYTIRIDFTDLSVEKEYVTENDQRVNPRFLHCASSARLTYEELITTMKILNTARANRASSESYADRLFKEMGFIKAIDGDVIYYEKYADGPDFDPSVAIYFDTERKSVSIQEGGEYRISMDIDLYSAMVYKIMELGWTPDIGSGVFSNIDMFDLK